MPDLPNFLIRPPLRCFHASDDRPGTVCGLRAVVQRPSSAPGGNGFFCELHRAPGDEPIAADALFRRVSITVEVLFSAVSFDPTSAQAEALCQLEQCLESVGAILNLHACRSDVGRARPGRPVAASIPWRPRPRS